MLADQDIVYTEKNKLDSSTFLTIQLIGQSTLATKQCKSVLATIEN